MNRKQRDVKTAKLKQDIRLTIVRPDGRRSEARIVDDALTPLMMRAAEDLLYVMCNNALPRGTR